MSAIINLNKLQREELHNYERPVTYLAYQNAELNRDKKKQRKAFQINDFYFYENKELANLPEAKYGAAAMELIRRNLFPSWCLFVYNELKEKADNAIPPELLCLSGDDILVLAPNIDSGIINGMVIASESASNTIRTLRSPCGLVVEVKTPSINHKYVAADDIEIQLLRIIENPEAK